MFDRFRGEVIMPHDEKNQHTMYRLRNLRIELPKRFIEIITKMIETAEGKKKKVIDKHIYHLGMCTLCNLCVKACPTGAIVMGQKFEHAVWDRTQLTKVLNQPGSELMKDVKE
jgi:NADH-quinone oxidoreductase subunit I